MTAASAADSAAEVSSSDAAAELGVSQAWVQRLCRANRLYARKLGRDWAIAEWSVRDFQRQRRRPGRPSGASSRPCGNEPATDAV